MQNTNERSEMTCPLNGKICKKGIRSDFENQDKECRWWIHLYGKDPGSEKMIDQFDCAVAWLPTIQSETTQMTTHTTASVDKTANVINELKGNLQQVGMVLKELAQASMKIAENQQKFLEKKPVPSLLNPGKNSE